MQSIASWWAILQQVGFQWSQYVASTKSWTPRGLSMKWLITLYSAISSRKLSWKWQTFFALRDVGVELQDGVQQFISHHGTQGINFCMHLLRGGIIRRCICLYGCYQTRTTYPQNIIVHHFDGRTRQDIVELYQTHHFPETLNLRLGIAAMT